MVALPAENGKRIKGSEILRLPRHIVPFVSDAFQLALDEQIAFPTLDARYLQRQLLATNNYLATQTNRHCSDDSTGFLGHLVGSVTRPDEAAFAAASSTQMALDQLEATRGHKAKNNMLSVLFEDAPPTLDSLTDLDLTLGTIVKDLKRAENPQGIAFRNRTMAALQATADARTNGNIAALTQREWEAGGCDEGRLCSLSEELILPHLAMPELDAITPFQLKHEYEKEKPLKDQPDNVRVLRRLGVVGHDVLRDVLGAIKDRERAAALTEHQSRLP